MANTKKRTAEKPQRLIYIGPTLKGFKLVKYQVFIGGYPTHITDVYEMCPQIKRLFVPVAELTKAEAAVKTSGTPLNKYYKMVQEV